MKGAYKPRILDKKIINKALKIATIHNLRLTPVFENGIAKQIMGEDGIEIKFQNGIAE